MATETSFTAQIAFLESLLYKPMLAKAFINDPIRILKEHDIEYMDESVLRIFVESYKEELEKTLQLPPVMGGTTPPITPPSPGEQEPHPPKPEWGALALPGAALILAAIAIALVAMPGRPIAGPPK